MYAGLVLTRFSGRLMGAHQKIDRVARRHVGELLPQDKGFPSIRTILKFEGTNGPDGIKRKSPARNEPWHFLNPLADDNQEFLGIIRHHHDALVQYLKEANIERSAFEAAWLAHAIVDGLTPAHHYPYEEKMEEVRRGKTKESRTTYRERLVFKGDTFAKTLLNNYKVYGPKGLMTAHFLFEFGFMFLVRPLRFPDARPTKKDIKELEEYGAEEYFMRRAREVAVMDLFERYLEYGWTPRLSNKVRHGLAPLMVKTVTMLWYSAAKEAGLCE